MRVPKYPALHPLIGLTARVVNSTNPAFQRITGHIVHETHGTITLSDGLRRIQIPKVSSIFEVTFPNGETARLAGKALLGHPAERLRRAKKLRW
jgi:RNase P/RNase MRP subunit p29